MSEYDRLLRLTLRLLSQRHRYSPSFPRSGPKDPVQLFVGTLPPNLDVEIPVPDEGEILGTVSMGTHVEMLLDVTLSTKQVLKFYEDHLQANGWVAHHHAGNYWNGFQHHTQPDRAFGQFDQGPFGAALNVVAFAEGGPTDLGLYLTTEVVPARPFLGDHRGRSRDSCIPGLSAPPQTTVEPQGGQYTPTIADSFADIQSALNVATVNDHYATQLRDAGWSVIGSAVDDTLTLSTWRFTYKGHQYAATMEFTERPDGGIAAHIHAEQDPLLSHD